MVSGPHAAASSRYLLVLALVSSLARGEVNVLGLLTTAFAAIGFTIIVATWGTRTFGRFVPAVQERLRVGEGEFALSMCLLFGLSLLAMHVSVAAIIGAFLAGMALSETVGPRVHDLAHGVTELLVPFFLAGGGIAVPFSCRFGKPGAVYAAAFGGSAAGAVLALHMVRAAALVLNEMATFDGAGITDKS